MRRPGVKTVAPNRASTRTHPFFSRPPRHAARAEPMAPLLQEITLDLPLKTVLRAYLIAHLRDESCVEVSKTPTEIKYTMTTDIPPLLHSAVGARVQSQETARISAEANTFTSTTDGALPGLSYRVVVTYAPRGENATAVSTDAEYSFSSTLPEHTRPFMTAFVASKVEQWIKELPAHAA